MTRNARKRKLELDLIGDEQMTRTDIAESMSCLHNGNAGSEVAIPKGNQESRLLKLPPEIKQKIWIMVVTEDAPITPIQLKDRSNKFIWSQAQIIKGLKVIGAVPELAAVQLAKVCRAMYEEVALTNLFYQYNTFDLSARNTVDAVTYLVAITDARLKAIRYMRVNLSLCRFEDRFHRQETLFTLLQICDGIQMLELDIGRFSSREDYGTSVRQLCSKTRNFLVMSLQKCKHFAVTLHATDKLVLAAKECCRVVKRYLLEQLKLNDNATVNVERIRIAKAFARLDVHGEGRLSEDRKPEFVSSRTRQGAKSAKALTPDGTMPKRLIARYDSEGTLNWFIRDILEVSEAENEDGTAQVEFRIQSSPYGRWSWQKIDENSKTSWEAATTLTSTNARIAIVEFYRTHSTAVGIDTIHEIWRDHPSDRRYHRAIGQLIRMKDAIEARKNASAVKKRAQKKGMSAAKSKGKRSKDKKYSKGTTGRQMGKGKI